jgi:hypothetical protein
MAAAEKLLGNLYHHQRQNAKTEEKWRRRKMASAAAESRNGENENGVESEPWLAGGSAWRQHAIA